MVITSPEPTIGRAGKSSTVPKAREAEFPLDMPVKTQSLRNMDQKVQSLREIFRGIALRTCMAALDRAGGDANVAAEDIMTKYPHEFGQFASPSPQIAEASSSTGPPTRPVNGTRIKLTLRCNYSPIRVKTEERSISPEIKQVRNVFESPTNDDAASRSSTPFDDDSDVDIDMDSDGDPEDADDEPEDPVDEPEDIVDDSKDLVGNSKDLVGVSKGLMDAKANELHVVFPAADLEECKRILQCADGNLQEAVDMMDEERGGELFGDTAMSGNSVGESSSAGPSSLYSHSSMSTHATNSVNGSGSGKKRAAEDSVGLFVIFNIPE
jgi:hypothetical protein